MWLAFKYFTNVRIIFISFTKSDINDKQLIIKNVFTIVNERIGLDFFSFYNIDIINFIFHFSSCFSVSINSLIYELLFI